jgi:hypothetical protein
MGRAAKLKKQRRQAREWKHFCDEAYKLEAHESKKPCHSCAFVDPEAMVADGAMGHKLLRCLTEGGNRFFCHEGMVTNAEGHYDPPKKPDGTIDQKQLTPCGGFLRWAAKYRTASRAEQIKAVQELQVHMCRRYLEGDTEHAADLRIASRNSPKLLAEALNLANLGELWNEPEED